MDRRRLGPAVADGDPRQDIGRVGLRVVDLDDPVAVVVEDARVQQLVLRLQLGAPAVLFDQVFVGEGRLRVVVAPAQPGAAGQRVQVPPVLLDVLAVVALAVGQPEHPLLEDRVAAVPQRQPQVEPPEQVRDAGHPVLVPAVRARARVVVRERGPCVATGAVVLPDGPPGPLRDVGSPLVPRAGRLEALLEVARVLHPLSLDAAEVGGARRLLGRRGRCLILRHRPASAAAPGVRRAARMTTDRGPAR